ncbi:DUF4336 domain-containing protein [Haliangium sp.]|uniref:DUF4336 domain-containing protein n=1 Tax=Haliangium sp. TaxID=2663208 RepID=UPI003D09DAC4
MDKSLTSLEPLVGDQIWVCERPVKFLGSWLRSRSLVVKLASGGLWVHSPPAPTDELRAALDDLGPVEWLVVPNRFHHLEMPRFAEAYPDATVIGPASVVERNAALRLDADIADPMVAERVPEIQAMPLTGMPFLDETLFFHRPTGTLIGADVALCATHQDHWTWRIPARLMGVYGRIKVSPDVRFRKRDRDALARSLEAILALPIEQLALAHTDLIRERPAEQLAAAWRFALKATAKTRS